LNAAFVIFDRMTALDFVGVYDPLTRLRSMDIQPDFSWRVCAPSSPVTDDRGLRFVADTVGESLAGYDLLVVPGGYGTRELRSNAYFVDWLRSASGVRLKAAVCTGSLLLGAAGFLQCRKATTHRGALAELGQYCSQIVQQRIVDEGDMITAGGVTAGIDLGLHLVQRLAGAEARARVAQQMEYRYVWEADA
jgi:cyclohexyl-isocyanide hydratase